MSDFSDVTDPIERVLLETYDRGGQHAVYDYVLANHSDWPWSSCSWCEDETPSWKTGRYEFCAVCFSVK